MKKSPTQEPPMSENEKLLPCPFCGTENVSMSFSATLMSADPAARFVECEECAACGPSCDIIDGDDDDAKRRALAAWKTRAALSTPPSKADADDVERVAYALWLDDAERAAPNVARHRTIETFRQGLSDRDREAWLRQARAALSAIQNRDAGLRAALKEAAEALSWAARIMKGNCRGSDIDAVNLAAGNAARAALLTEGENHE